MNDKEKIEEALRLIEKLSIHKRFVHGFPFKDLEEIKKILDRRLEKFSGYGQRFTKIIPIFLKINQAQKFYGSFLILLLVDIDNHAEKNQ